MKKKTRRRIWRVRPAGLDPARTAPYWSGERAETIVKERVKELAREKEERKRRAAAKRAETKRKNAARRR